MPDSKRHSRYRSHPVPKHVVKSPSGHAARAAEQDAAAGGRERRQIDLGDGVTATASAQLFMPKNGFRAYAQLRYKTRGKTHSHYLGDVSADERSEALRRAWELARAKGIAR